MIFSKGRGRWALCGNGQTSYFLISSQTLSLLIESHRWPSDPFQHMFTQNTQTQTQTLETQRLKHLKHKNSISRRFEQLNSTDLNPFSNKTLDLKHNETPLKTRVFRVTWTMNLHVYFCMYTSSQEDPSSRMKIQMWVNVIIKVDWNPLSPN